MMMEPLAPGTEDDSPIFSSTKQEKERERLLGVKASLPNGTYGNVFELSYVNGTEHWYCNACACPVMGWVFHHEIGKRHSIAMGNKPGEQFQSSHDNDDVAAIQIAPGEPVPPGFEGQVEKVAMIQERLDAFNIGPLLALEYLLELKDYDVTKEPTYLCVLCDKKGDPRTVLTHLASYKHILQYLQKHFPTCYRSLAPYMTKQYKRNWQNALHEIAEAIEKKFGRLKPMPVDAGKYEKDTLHYLELIGKGKHFSELTGFTFEELVNKDELTKQHDDDDGPRAQKKKSPSPPVVANPIKKIRSSGSAAPAQSSAAVGTRRRSLSSVSSVSSSDLSDFDPQPVQKAPVQKAPVHERERKSRSPYGRRYDRYNRRSPPPAHYRKSPPRPSAASSHYTRRNDRGLLPWERSDYRRTKPDTADARKSKFDKMEEYKKLCKAIDNDMERVVKQHKKNPEKHPQYNDEWKKFWNKRYKELQTEGKDAANHDFKPEWIEFWNGRMIELHQDEIKSKKEALRKRLAIDEPSPISFKIQMKKRSEQASTVGKNGKPVPPSAQPDQEESDVIVIEDVEEGKNKRRSHSPWEEEPAKRSESRLSERSRVSAERSRASHERSRTSRGRSRASNERSRVSRERNRTSHERSRASRERSRASPERIRTSRERNRTSRDRSRPSRSRSRSYERDYKYKKSFEREPYWPRERIRTTAELPWERNKVIPRNNDLPAYYKPPAVMRDVTREPVITPPPVIVVPPTIEAVDDAEINLVSVLRLLTALEDRLGSLGPKVIDLLAQALAMEKKEAFSSETLLDNEINIVMFETVKEKLKGQLLAGMVEVIHEKAFKIAIKKTASLIHLASERKRENLKQSKVDPVKVPGVGTVDKAAIAKQIANALVAQGKTDVTQAQLEQLINAVVGMAEASKNTSKPMTTAAFLEHINKAGAAPQTKDKEVVATVTKPAAAEVKQATAKEKSEEKAPQNMDGLSDSDLQTLLQNFKDLSTEEQHGLINYLKKLEAHEPERVERLRKFVNMGGSAGGTTGAVQVKSVEKPTPVPVPEPAKKSGRESPFANRMGSLNPTMEEKKPAPKVEPPAAAMTIDSDEEDYSFEDVAKAASKNVQARELEREREANLKKDEFSLDDTKALISNIMSNINKKDNATPAPPTNLFALPGNPLASVDFKTLDSIPVNLANLANIVGSVQSMSSNNAMFPAPGPSQGQFMPQQSMNSLGFEPSKPTTSYEINYNQGMPYENRQSVGYPLDKTKMAYPNYGMYGPPGNQNPQPPRPGMNQQQQQQQQQFGNRNFGNNPRGNNSYNNSRW